MLHYITSTSTPVPAEQVEQLRQPITDGYTVAVQPPRGDGVPSTVPFLVQALREPASGFLGIGNRSAVIVYEIRRSIPDQITVQYTVPTKRLERTVRTQLAGAIPGIGFTEGDTGLPVTEDTPIGGAVLHPSREQYYPLRCEFPFPPVNAIIGALHPHAMRDTKFILQLVAQPIAGERLRTRWHRLLARKQMDYLRKEKEKFWGSRKPTRQERKRADAIEDKIGPQWRCSLRVFCAGSQHVASRTKEIGNAYSVFENTDTGQQLQTSNIRPIREAHIIRFAHQIAERRFGGWSHPFRASNAELAGLMTVPGRSQQNLQRAQP